MTELPLGLAPLPLGAVGEFVPTKQIWLLKNVEVTGVVVATDPPDEGFDPAIADGDSLDIVPDPSCRHVVDHMRGNNPMPWKPLGTPWALHCETYPMTGGPGRLFA